MTRNEHRNSFPVVNTRSDRHRARHPIRVVTARTGLSPDILRTWERRYGVVTPVRSDGGQRLYSDADIDRLALIYRATMAGRSIGAVAATPPDELAVLVAEDADRSIAPPAPAARHLEPAMAAVAALDPERLELLLRRALLSVGTPVFLEEVLAPLFSQIGDAWHAGSLGIAHEHAASVVAHRLLDSLIHDLQGGEGSPVVVVATPALERHAFGGMVAAAAAAHDGWRVLWLGPDVPARDIAAAARQHHARVVGLSVVTLRDIIGVRAELRSLRRTLPAATALLVGGPGVQSLEPLGRGITPVRDLPHWRALLRGHSPARGRKAMIPIFEPTK